MSKQQYKEAIILQFIEWVVSQEALDFQKVSVRDFDVWVAGYISGISINNESLTNEDVEEIVEHLVHSDKAKSMGIIGTEKQSMTENYLAIKK